MAKKEKWIWFDGQMVPWQDAKTHVLSHTIHYGDGVFEGLRFYDIYIGSDLFKLDAHIERLFYSCKKINLKLNYSHDEICQAIIATVQKAKLKAVYIRPLAFFGAGDLRIIARDLPVHLIIAC